MPSNIGYSFQPSPQDVRVSGNGRNGGPRIGPQEAVRMFSLRIPKAPLGQSPIAPRALLESPGGAGMPILNQVLAALAQAFAPAHQAGVPSSPVATSPAARPSPPPSVNVPVGGFYLPGNEASQPLPTRRQPVRPVPRPPLTIPPPRITPAERDTREPVREILDAPPPVATESGLFDDFVRGPRFNFGMLWPEL